jgi:Fe-S oxidoreductase
MIGNNSCGTHSVMAGETADNVEELEILTYDGARMTVGATSDERLEQIIREGGRHGEIYSRLKSFRDKYADLIRKEFPRIPRRVSGYNLTALLPENGFQVARALVGSECTCALVHEAATRLVYWPPVRSLLVIGYSDIFEAADHVTEPLPFKPIALEALDDTFIDDMKKKGMHPKHLNMMPEGRAWLLVEMIRGETITDGWRSEEVHEALDLCLACKGCKGECPVQVDMATYKSEFLSHYYEGRLRPRSAYTMGHIHLWARLAALVPHVANFVTHAPVFASLARLVADVHPDRTIPKFAPYTFKQWFHRRETKRASHQSENGNPKSEIKRVILWPDTFNNHFHPRTAQAAVAVLEAAGFEVEVPRQNVCCGRPLYDCGMLDEAKRLLREILILLKEPIEQGVPVVVLEPSCATVFREELTNLFPNDEDAKRLSEQTLLLSDFLEQKAPDFRPPKLKMKGVVHGHCHHRSIMKMEAEEAVLRKMGVDYEMPETGCCGMAGS